MTRSFSGRYRSLFVTRVLVVAIVAVLGVNIGDALSPANASVGSSNWTSYMNGNNSGFNSSVGFSSSHATITPANASMLTKVWTATSGGPVFAQPIVANGNVYWGSFDGYERATSTSGTLVWKTFLGTTTPPAGTCEPPSAGVASTATYRTDVPIGASRVGLVRRRGRRLALRARREQRRGAVAPLARREPGPLHLGLARLLQGQPLHRCLVIR